MGRRAPRGGGKTVPKFGEFLRRRRELRPEDKRSYEAVAKDLHGLGFSCSASTIWRYENDGRVPDVAFINGISILYGLSFDGLTRALRHELTQTDTSDDEIEHLVLIDPLWHRGRDKTAPSTKAGVHALSPADSRVFTERITRLEKHVDALTSTLADVAGLAGKILQHTGEIGETGAPGPSRGRNR